MTSIVIGGILVVVIIVFGYILLSELLKHVEEKELKRYKQNEENKNELLIKVIEDEFKRIHSLLLNQKGEIVNEIYKTRLEVSKLNIPQKEVVDFKLHVKEGSNIEDVSKEITSKLKEITKVYSKNNTDNRKDDTVTATFDVNNHYTSSSQTHNTYHSTNYDSGHTHHFDSSCSHSTDSSSSSIDSSSNSDSGSFSCE